MGLSQMAGVPCWFKPDGREGGVACGFKPDGRGTLLV